METIATIIVNNCKFDSIQYTYIQWVTARTCLYFFDYDAIYYSLTIGAYSITSFASLSYIFSANFSIIVFIIQTFDFWYKMYNMTLFIVSAYFINLSFTENIIYYVTVSFTIICAYGFSFIFDAISIQTKYKNLFIITAVSWGVYVALNVYFSVDDDHSTWNPFEKYNFQHSKINFKSILVSSQINLCLFMLKPIFIQISRKIRRFICNNQNIRQNLNIKDYSSFIQSSYVLYKRPYVHWTSNPK